MKLGLQENTNLDSKEMNERNKYFFDRKRKLLRKKRIVQIKRMRHPHKKQQKPHNLLDNVI